jgi:hypothetical protein
VGGEEKKGSIELKLARTRRPDVDCYNYGKHEHYVRDCWTEKKVEGKINYAEMNDESSSRITKGYLDTEANNRMNSHEPDGGDDRDGEEG